MEEEGEKKNRNLLTAGIGAIALGASAILYTFYMRSRNSSAVYGVKAKESLQKALQIFRDKKVYSLAVNTSLFATVVGSVSLQVKKAFPKIL